MEKIDLEVKLKKNEWVKLNFLVGYTNPIVLFLTLVGIGMSHAVFDYLTINTYQLESFPFIHATFGLFILIFLPISTYIQSLKKFKSNKWINQKLHYQFNDTTIQILGETFELIMKWSDVKSIREVRNFCLIYTDKQQGLFIPKNSFENQKKEEDFRGIIRRLHDIKVKLK